jgi:hypothetical protein
MAKSIPSFEFTDGNIPVILVSDDIEYNYEPLSIH